MSLTVIPLVEDNTLGIDQFGFLYRINKNGTHKALSPSGSCERGGPVHWYVNVNGKKTHYQVDRLKCRFQDCTAKRSEVLA